MVNANAAQLRLTFGSEELIYLLTTLGVGFMPGLDLAAFAVLSDQERLLIMQSAAHSLQARQFIAIDAQGQVTLDTQVAALVGTCMAPDASMLLEHYQPGQTTAIYLHATHLLAVEHRLAAAGVHEFSVLADPARHIGALFDRLELPATPTPAALQAALPVQPARMQEARQAIIQGHPEAMDLLTAAGIPAPIQPILREFLATQASSAAFALSWRQADGQGANVNAALLLGSHGALQLTATSDEAADLRAVDRSELEALAQDAFATIAAAQGPARGVEYDR